MVKNISAETLGLPLQKMCCILSPGEKYFQFYVCDDLSDTPTTIYYPMDALGLMDLNIYSPFGMHIKGRSL